MNRRGFTLTELAIVLGVIGLMLGAIWSASAMVMRHQNVNQTAKQVLITASNIRELFPQGFNNQSANQNITTAVVAAGVFPNDAELKLSPTYTNPDGSPFYNPMTAFGSPYWVGGRSNNDPNQFGISLNLVTLSNPASVCGSIIGAMLSSQSNVAPAYIYNGYNTIAVTPSVDISSFTPCSEAVFIFQIKSTI